MNDAVRYWARRSFRRNLRGVIVLVLLVAIGSGGAMGAVAGARRSQTALDRLVSRSAMPDAFVFAEDDKTLEKALALPEVGAVLGFTGLGLQPEGTGCTDATDDYFPIGAPTRGEPYVDVDRPKLVSGRLPDQSDPGEIALAQQHARRLGLRVGDRLRLLSFGDEGEGCSDELIADLEVVGIVRSVTEHGARESDPVTMTLVTTAFLDAHPEVPILFSGQAMVRKARGVTVPELSRSIEEVGAFVEPVVGEGPAGPALDAIAVGLLAVGAVLAFSATAALIVAIARQVEASVHDLRILSAIGLGPGPLAIAAATPTLVASIVGVALGTGVAMLLSTVHLIGLAGRVEPDPGFDVDLGVLAAGSAATALVTVLLVVAFARRVVRLATRPDTDVRLGGSNLTARLSGSGAPPWASIGAGYALGGGRTGRLPSRSAALGAAVGVAGVVAVLVFARGLDDARATPAIYGWGDWDAWVAGGDDDASDEGRTVLPDDPAIDAASLIRPRFALDLAGETILGIEIEHLKGRTGPSVVEGRLPEREGEIALGENTADDLGVSIGDQVRAAGPDGDLDLEVVGTAAFPAYDSDPIARGFLVDRSTTERLGYADECPTDTSCFQNVAIRWAEGADVEAAMARLGEGGYDFELPDPGAEVRRLSEVDSLPQVLAAALALIAAIGLAHALGVTVTRRRQELAVIRAVGFVKSQVRAVLLVEGAVLGLTGAVVGVVAGGVLGRMAWAVAADAIGISRHLSIPVITMVSVAGGTLVLALALSVVPAMAAARSRVGVALRAE